MRMKRWWGTWMLEIQTFPVNSRKQYRSLMGPRVTRYKSLLGSLIVPEALPVVEPTLPETLPGKLLLCHCHRVARMF